MFSSKFCEIFNNTFFTERLWTTASVQVDLSDLFNYQAWI